MFPLQCFYVSSRAVILNWWVADPFSVGRGPLPGQKKMLRKKGDFLCSGVPSIHTP